MLAPGTWSWSDAIPIAGVALILLFVPGLLTAVLLRVRPALALAVAPALTTGIVAVGGMVFGAARVAWSPVTLAATVLSAWVLAALTRLVLRSVRPSDKADAQSRVEQTSDSVLERPAPWATGRIAQTLGTLAGTTFAFWFFARLLIWTSDTPAAFPQHPDTIFHLGLPQWMVENQDISFFHVLGFTTGGEGGGYPAGFHAMTATLAMLTDVPVVVATSAFVLVSAGIAWPLGMAELARTLLGRTPQAGALGAATSVLFTAFPYMLITFGVLWPNFYGQAILPGALVCVALLLEGLRAGVSRRRALAAGGLGVLCLPGLALAHYQAFVTFAVFAALMVLVATMRRALERRGTWSRFLPLAVTVVGLALAALASRVVAPASMVATGASGPELSPAEGREDALQFAPRGTENLTWLAVLVLVGAIFTLWRYRSALWATLAGAAMVWLFYINVAIDSPWAREFTWPWYNNAVRLSGVGVLPAALLVSVAILGLAGILVGWSKWRDVLNPIASAALLGVLLVGTSGYWATKYDWMNDFFHPAATHWWASPDELKALRALAEDVPEDAKVAANPWNGGSYMYIVSGQPMLWPTEKTNNTPDRQLLGRELDRAGTDPRVCAAAQRLGVEWAVTGGTPFAWATTRRMEEYAGVDAIGSTRGWEAVATEGPFTLHRLVSCAQ